MTRGGRLSKMSNWLAGRSPSLSKGWTMKTRHCVAYGAVLCALALLGRSVADDAQPLRYAWKKGSEHYCRVSIKAELESGPEELISEPMCVVAESGDGELKLLFFGGLTATKPQLFRTGKAYNPLS